MQTTTGAAIAAALEGHNRARKYVLRDETHALEMLLADVVAYCDEQSPRLDLDTLIASAQEIAANS